MKQRKLSLLFIVFCLVLPLAILFTACDGTAQEEPVEPAGHTHTWSDEWSVDENQHWHICTGEDCDEIHDLGEHVYNDPHSTDCIICGRTRELDHTPKSAWVTNETHHWHECNETGCELKFNYEEHEPEDHYGFCKCGYYCGFTMTVGLPTQNIVIEDNSPSYFRFTASANKDYCVSLHSFIKAGTNLSSRFTIYQKSGSNYIPIYENLASDEYVHISTSGTYYCVIENSEARVNGMITVNEENHEATMENHGVTPCGAYLGLTKQISDFTGNELILTPETSADNLTFYRIAISENEWSYNFATNTSETVMLFYYDTTGEIVEIELTSAEPVDIAENLVSAGDAYIYIVVSAEQNMTASETIVVTKTALE